MRLFAYFGTLSVRTIYGYLLSLYYLGPFQYPSSVYFNIALMIPMFLDYKDLILKKEPYSLKYCVKVSALMLLEDILLDELNADSERIITLFESTERFIPQNRLERKTLSLYTYLRKNLSTKQIELLKNLNLAQVKTESNLNWKEFETAAMNKGLWFPGLVFSFNSQMSDMEIRALTLMGFWIKSVDDYVDYSDDLINEKVTVFTHKGQSEKPKIYIESLRLQVFSRMKELDYAPDKIAAFLYRISVATYAFKLHNELLKKMPRFYQLICNKFQILLLINMVIACMIGFQKLKNLK